MRAECPQCHTVFTQNVFHHKFCRHACREAWRRALGWTRTVRKICEQCGKAFGAFRKQNRFCSYACAVRGRSGVSRRSRHPCLECARPIPAKQKYCSVACRVIAARRNGAFLGAKNPNYRNAAKRTKCPTCGIEIVDYAVRRFCSWKCKRVINTKKKGRRAEWRARSELRRAGYVVVLSEGSLGAFDLIALRDSEIRLLQIKAVWRLIAAVENAFRKDLARLAAVPVKAQKELWLWVDHRGWEKRGWNGIAWVPLAQMV